MSGVSNGFEIRRVSSNFRYIFNDGNVGIGTTSPNSILEISQASPIFRIQASDNGTFHGIEFRQGAGFDAFIKQLPSTGEFRISNGRSVGWGGFTSFYTDTTEKMRITSSGNVGIGTQNPNGIVDIREGNRIFDAFGNLNVMTSDGFAQNIGGSIALGGASGGGTSPYPFAKIQGIKEGGSAWAGALILGTTQSNSAITEKMRITSGGNVGIGEGSPSEKLTIAAGNIKLNSFQNVPGQYRYIGSEFATGNGNNKAEIRFGIDTGDTNTFLSFATASGAGTINDRMRIYSNGNIAKLTLTGIDGNFDNVIKYGFPGDLNSGDSRVNRWIGIDATITAGAAITNTLRVRAYGGGGGNAAPVNVVDFRGDLSTLFYGNVTAVGFFNSSDIRLKELTPYDYSVSDIKLISYLWKDGRDDKKHVGYSAQEVQKIMPDAVNEGTDGMLSVNYIEVLVAKIAELENRIKQLEK
jgi:hypothetical protein